MYLRFGDIYKKMFHKDCLQIIVTEEEEKVIELRWSYIQQNWDISDILTPRIRDSCSSVTEKTG